MKEEGEVKLLQKDNNNKNISKKKGIICNSDIEGWFEFYPKLFIKYGFFNEKFKEDFPELCYIIENPPTDWQQNYRDCKGNTYSCSYYEYFIDLIGTMLSTIQNDVGKYLNENFDKQIILCGDFISNRPFGTGHYPPVQHETLNYYIIELLSVIKTYLKINTTNDNTEKLDNHSLILIAGNHELFTCGKDDCNLNRVKRNFASEEVLQPYYVTYDKNDNALIFKHAPFATKEQYEEMMTNNVPAYLKYDDLVTTDISFNDRAMTKAVTGLKRQNILYDYQELFDTNDKNLKKMYGDGIIKMRQAFEVFKKNSTEQNDLVKKYIKQYHFYWNFFDDSKVYPIIGRNYFNTDDFKGNKNVLLIHGHTHEGQRETIPATTFCNIESRVVANNNLVSCKCTCPNWNPKTESFNGYYIKPIEMKEISQDRIKKDRRFCVDTDLFVPYVFFKENSSSEQCFFNKTYPYDGHDSYVHNFIIDITAKSPKITAIDHWNANEKKESQHIYEIDNIFETKTMNNYFASIGSHLCSCCSCGSLSCW